jgi:uncharacterized protein (DUF2164 family)
MEKIEFTQEEKTYIVQKIKKYFIQELDEEIGQFDAEFLLDFFGDELGPYFYNKGLQDAQKVLESQIDVIKETFYTMEEPTYF